jgi:hypothetical protein
MLRVKRRRPLRIEVGGDGTFELDFARPFSLSSDSRGVGSREINRLRPPREWLRVRTTAGRRSAPFWDRIIGGPRLHFRWGGLSWEGSPGGVLMRFASWKTSVSVLFMVFMIVDACQDSRFSLCSVERNTGVLTDGRNVGPSDSEISTVTISIYFQHRVNYQKLTPHV